jgi:hypothetical protein
MPTLPSPCSRNNLGVVRKPAAAVLPYKIDFAQWLASLHTPATATTGDTIATATVTVAQTLGAVAVVSPSNTTALVHFQLTGGQSGERAQLRIEIVTTLGNSDVFSLLVEVE